MTRKMERVDLKSIEAMYMKYDSHKRRGWVTFNRRLGPSYVKNEHYSLSQAEYKLLRKILRIKVKV